MFARVPTPLASLNCHEARMTAFVLDDHFPCVGARSAAKKDRMRFGLYKALGDIDSAHQLCADLAKFSAEFPSAGEVPVSFVAMFESARSGERDFSNALWSHLEAMHDADRLQYEWDPAVSSDAHCDSFSFSIAGRAFFVVGLHPDASRSARRTPFPCLVFNFHDQFETLKRSGKYAGMQKVIRARDVALQGSINPSLARFGEASEARQYAGDLVATDWVCPFVAKKAIHAN